MSVVKVGPLSIGWNDNQGSKSNANTAAAIGAVMGIGIGIAGSYVVPNYGPTVVTAVSSGTDKVVTFTKGLFASKKVENNGKSATAVPTSSRRWYFLWLA